MHSSISFGLILTALCILDVSHGNGTKPNVLQRLLTRKSSNAASVSAPVQERVPQQVKPGKTQDILSDEVVNQVRYDIFRTANRYRSLHGLKEFTTNADLEKEAQKLAINSAGYKIFSYKEDGPYAVNFYRTAPFNHVGEAMVDLWYMELGHYNKKSTDKEKSDNKLALNVSQLLWKNTKEISIGVAVDFLYKLYHIVVIYNQRGNKVGEYKNNEPIFDLEKAKEEYIKEKNIDNELGGRTLLHDFGGDEKTPPNLPGWSSYYYPTPQVTIDKKKIENSVEYKQLFGV